MLMPVKVMAEPVLVRRDGVVPLIDIEAVALGLSQALPVMA